MIPFQIGTRVCVNSTTGRVVNLYDTANGSGRAVALHGKRGTIIAPSAWPHDWIVRLDAFIGTRDHSFEQASLSRLTPLELLAEVAE